MMKQLFALLLTIGFLPTLAQERTNITLQTNVGDIVLELYDETPLHRDNFIQKVQDGFFTGKRFDRVIRDFMIQCGEEQVEHNLPAEICYPQHFHKRGALAMGRSGDDAEHLLESNAEQFYIVWGKEGMTEAYLNRSDSLMKAWSYGRQRMKRKMRKYYSKHPGTPFLDGSYTVFGEVVKGLEVVDRIQSTQTDNKDKPIEPVIILSAAVSQPSSRTEGNEFTIQIQEMVPQQFSSRSVSYGYSLTLRNDSVDMYLPYMGVSYQPEFNNEGLNMKKPAYNYQVSSGKKGSKEICFSCKRDFVEYKCRVTLYSGGKAYVHLLPSNAQAISYSGYWE